MRRSSFAVLLLVSLAARSAAAQRNGASFPLNVVTSATFGEEAALLEITAGTVGPTGNVYVVDRLSYAVVAFSPAGRMLWKVGRKGRGPGEYQLPYRIAASPSGTLLVYDLGTGDVTTLSQNGRFLSRSHLPFRIHYVDDIAAAGSDLLVAGYSPDAAARRNGIHRFRIGGNLAVHAGSFGPLPTVRDTAILSHWGAGDITRAANGDLLFALALPYVVYRFDAAGRQRMLARPSFRVRGTPEDAVRIERNGPMTVISNTEAIVDRPRSVFEVANGSILVTRITTRSRHWDLFTSTGRFAGSREYPEAWGGVLAFDSARNFLWMAATHDDAPVLVRLQVTFGAATPSRRVQ